MNGYSRRVGLGLALVVVGGAAGSAGCTGAIVHSRPDAKELVSNVSAVVAMPPRLGFGKAGDQRRAARRTSDTLIQETGGHAILADELQSIDPELIADSVRSFGEDPARTLTFSVIAARAERLEAATVSSVSGARAVHRF